MPTYLGTLGENRPVKLGSELGLEDQKLVLAVYLHRFTKQHRPAWKSRPDCAACPVQFKDDADWLANTFFVVSKSGRLNHLASRCESHPTWPEGRVGLPLAGEGVVAR